MTKSTFHDMFSGRVARRRW